MTAGTEAPGPHAAGPGPLELVRESERARLLLHPLRQRILEAAGEEPLSAAEAARRIGVPRQKVNYHVGELARGGFLEEVEERRRGNLIEKRYRAVARGWVLAPEVLGSAAPRAPSVEDAFSAARLLALSARIQSELGRAMGEAADRKQRISTMSIDAELRFESPEQRAGFADALREAVLDVVARHASPFRDSDGTPAPGRPYRLVLGCHPIPKEGEEAEE